LCPLEGGFYMVAILIPKEDKFNTYKFMLWKHQICTKYHLNEWNGKNYEHCTNIKSSTFKIKY
jgi:hypothetical protein